MFPFHYLQLSKTRIFSDSTIELCSRTSSKMWRIFHLLFDVAPGFSVAMGKQLKLQSLSMKYQVKPSISAPSDELHTSDGQASVHFSSTIVYHAYKLEFISVLDNI